MLATLKFGIPHDEQPAGHGVHTFAVLSATNAPCCVVFPVWQTPEESVCTHDDPNLTRPAPHAMHWSEVAPVQVEQSVLHAVQDEPLLKEPSGQTVPLEVVVEEVGAMHCVVSDGLAVSPDWQVMQDPDWAAQEAQPSEQAVR